MDVRSFQLVMIFKWYLKIAIILHGSIASSAVVQTTHGPIEGKTITLPSGKEVEAFLGVPFASPPTGKNRFAPPQPLDPWKGTLQVKSLPKSCIQAVPKSIRSSVWYAADSEESEDCLYLNLWVPKNTTNAKRPVMIWIHGGAFLAGSSNMPLYDGSVLSSENEVIIASMNYRLSMLGFLYLNNTEVRGNAGLQDQIRAIEWIRDNAQNFGGHSQKITLFGESAGSKSVGFHMVNVNLESLFQYGILESGTVNTGQTVKSEAEIFGSSVSAAKSLGCSFDDLNKTLKCLRQKSVSDILVVDIGILRYLRVAFAPVKNGIEVPVDIDIAIQRLPPEKRKNSMTGNIPREMGGFITDLFPGKLLDENLSVSEEDMRVFLGNVNGISDTRLEDIILHEYRNYNEKYNKSQIRIEATELITDLSMQCPCLKFLRIWTTRPNQVYYYYFTHRPSKGFKVQVPQWMGAVHGDEIPFVFGRPLESENGYTADEVVLSRKMMTYMCNFAKTGNPNGGNLGGLTWPSVIPHESLSYLELNLNSTARTSLKEKECDFWDNVYPSILSVQDQLKAIPSA